MRIMLREYTIGIPRIIRASFFHVLSRIMYATKTANMRKPIRLYMPEQAMSTVKFNGVPSVL